MTPAYCSPEQANRETLTRRTDLWSWGLCVLEMFQGERSWQIGTIAAQALEFYLQGRQEDSQLPQMPESVALLLQRCFRENPDERPGNMLEVANELQGIYQQVARETYPRQEPKAGKDTANTLNNRAVSLLDLGRESEALQLWEQALKVQPHHPESTYNKGLILWRSGRINDDTLVRDIKQVQQSHPGNWVADYLLGLVHLERDDCEAAIKILEGIQGEGVDRKEVKAALALAKDRLPHSKRLLHTFEGHKSHISQVKSVALSRDCNYGLSGSCDKALKLWDVETGVCVRTFEGHEHTVASVCLSGDGQFVLSGSFDKTLKLWEVATGRCLRTFEGHTQWISSVSLNTDGRLALSASGDGTLKLWEVATGRCLRTWEIDGIWSACLSGDGRLALSGGFKTLKLWEVATGSCLRTFEGHTASVMSICLSGDGQFALSGRSDNMLKLWEITTGRCLRTFEGHTSWVNSVCLSADGRLALSGSGDMTVKLWEVATGRCLRTFKALRHKPEFLYVNADDQFRFALSGGDYADHPLRDENSLKLWAINGTEINSYIAPIMLSRILATEIALSVSQIYERELAQARADWKQGDVVAAAQHIRKARAQPGYSRSMEAMKVWAELYLRLPRRAFVGGWEGVTLFEGQTGFVTAVCLSANSQFALFRNSTMLKLLEIDTGHCLHTFDAGEGHKIFAESICLSADSRFALSGSWDTTLKLWEVATGRCVRTFQGHTDQVRSGCLSADGRFALSGSRDKTLKLWEVATGRCVRTFQGHTDQVSSGCLSADGRFALSGSWDTTLKLWEVATGFCLRTFEGHTHKVESICLSADGRFALSGSWDTTLKLWEVATGRCVRTFEGHTGWVYSVCMSADGQIALSGSDDKTLKLWEATTGRCLSTFEGHTQEVESVCLSADGRFALSGSWDKTLKLWILDWELEDRQPANWDEGARPYLETFLTQHTPYAATLPEDREPTELEIYLAITRLGTPTWTEEDFQNLLYTLGCVGYGWLRPEGVRQHLDAMAASWEGASPSVEELVIDRTNLASRLAEALAEAAKKLEVASVRSPEASSPAPIEIESIPKRRRLVFLLTRRNRMVVVTFLGLYFLLLITMTSILSLEGWISLLLPVVPASLFAWFFVVLLNWRSW